MNYTKNNSAEMLLTFEELDREICIDQMKKAIDNLNMENPMGMTGF